MTEVLSQQQLNTGMKSPQHLKKWLAESGREWIVINSSDWVDALPFPDFHNLFMQMCARYGAYRATLESGRTKLVETEKGEVEFPVMKAQTLEIEELDSAIRYLIRQASELDSNWSLENPAL